MDDCVASDKETISLVIKTPNQIHGDQFIEGVNMNWTVKDLKNHLANVYPSKPAANEQRLIYSGKLLPDHLHIRDAFRETDTLPTLHLVCAFRPQPASHQLGARPKVRAAEQDGSSQAQQRADPATPAPSAPAAPSATSLRQRGHPAPAVPAAVWSASGAGTNIPAPSPAEMTHPAFPTYSLYSPQQLIWLQHIYARQYYMQYQAAMVAAASAPVSPAHSAASLPVAAHQAAVPAALPNQGPIDNLPANHNAPDPAFINPEGANQNLRMNAQGGPVMEDEEDMERDWLDWVYTASRFAVFLSIVYFYSNLSRFILVMSSLILIYLHTTGWFPFRPRAQARPVNQPAPEVIQNQENQDRQPEPVAPRPEEGEAEGEGVQDAEQTAVPVSPVRPPVLWTAWLFFKAFFASLIPEAPQGVAN
ncbi:homocysteine-responsive endoplasmic reticulum-resident ubiquitin-like domain member 1 protein [Brachyhypopomus gauderio]|uniref:homocysteine-responsive endoplasmic reticulum-resident ubiquitin-like domain member 1 protein n=1 Tax=Brachyhypopomus gauderio TaxID=698409 RepID=UPI0040432312